MERKCECKGEQSMLQMVIRNTLQSIDFPSSPCSSHKHLVLIPSKRPFLTTFHLQLYVPVSSFPNTSLCLCLSGTQRVSSHSSPRRLTSQILIESFSPLQLLCIDVQKRISCLAELQDLNYMSDVKWDAVLSEQIPPGFIPNVSFRKKSETCHCCLCLCCDANGLKTRWK